jgi:hypothetical protein
MKPLFAVLFALLVCGCATSDFTPYEGAQQKWPTSTGTFVRTINSYNGPGRSGTGKQYTLPVYFGLPNRPYIVLGYVDVETPVGRLFEGSAETSTLKPAVREAGQHGADAIIVVAQGVETRGYGTSTFGNLSSNTSGGGVLFGNGVYTGHATTTENFFGGSFTAPNRSGKARQRGARNVRCGLGAPSREHYAPVSRRKQIAPTAPFRPAGIHVNGLYQDR